MGTISCAHSYYSIDSFLRVRYLSIH
ncbi:hypothetical protein SBDP1_90090 [Syntrophobacter sp. SbD1]|nr:hypothetical protein SBDP1_90090 [Syntrophobacter sp. SbD1]